MWPLPQEQAGIDMAQEYFQFRKFTIHQDKTAMKVTTPACLFGAWCAVKLANYSANKTALDIGTATGLLSLMIAQKNELDIDAIEIDRHAAQQATENLRTSEFDSITIIEGDVREIKLPTYDIIFSNPPFYENELKSPDAARNTAHHSENLSWEELFSIIQKHLDEKGRFYLLLPAKRINDLEDLSSRNYLHLHQLIYVRPTSSQQPSWIMVEGGKEKSALQVSEIIIRDSNGYTNEFTALLKDYYLKL
jgi:tRNA1Val (adenine37-N6)-methyltransferase